MLGTGRNAAGDWQGIAPNVARAMAARLRLRLKFVAYETPGELADPVDSGAWTICMIGADPARSSNIRFSLAYTEIEATYLVPPRSVLRHVDEVDRPGNRIAVFARSAYDLWLTRNLHEAKLIRGDTFDAAFDYFRNDALDALACLTTKLHLDAERWPESRVLDGHFMSVRQAVGTSAVNADAAEFIASFVEELKMSGLLAKWLAEQPMRGLAIAPARVI